MFDDFTDSVARTYAESRQLSPEVLQFWSVKIAEFAPRSPGKNIVLDIGAGTGRFSQALAYAGPVVSIDTSPHMLGVLEAARAQSHAILASAERMPLRDSSFDVLFASAVVHHVNLQRFLQEAHRTLRSKGILVIRGTLLDDLVRHPVSHCSTAWFEIESQKLPSRVAILEAAASVGLTFLECTSYDEPHSSSGSEYLSKLKMRPYYSMRRMPEDSQTKLLECAATLFGGSRDPVAVPISIVVLTKDER